MISWSEFDLELLDDVVDSTPNGTCPRANVKAGVAQMNIHNKMVIISRFSNRSPQGKPTCFEVGCAMYHGNCVRTLHAESGAMLMAGYMQARFLPTLITTHLPCMECCKDAVFVGIKNIIAYDYPYHDERVEIIGAASRLEYLESAGVHVRLYPAPA